MFQSVTAVSIELFYFIVNYFVILAIIYHFWDFRRFSAVKNYGRLWIHDGYILDTEKAGLPAFRLFQIIFYHFDILILCI